MSNEFFMLHDFTRVSLFGINKRKEIWWQPALSQLWLSVVKQMEVITNKLNCILTHWQASSSCTGLKQVTFLEANPITAAHADQTLPVRQSRGICQPVTGISFWNLTLESLRHHNVWVLGELFSNKSPWCCDSAHVHKSTENQQFPQNQHTWYVGRGSL